MPNPELQFKLTRPDCTGLRVSELDYAVLEDLYGEKRRYQLDVLEGEDRPAGPLPVVIFLHGGGFAQPCDKRQSYVSMFARALTGAGYVVAAPDYPVYDTHEEANAPGALPPACRRCADAVWAARDFLEQNAGTLGIRVGKPAIFGGSAGGWGAFYTVARAPSAFSALVNLWGAPEPLPDVTGFPPVFSVHGTADELVPYERELVLAQKLEEAGAPHTLVTLEGRGHTPLADMPEYMPRILAFLSSLPERAEADPRRI